jgi:hypothetical protein
MALKTDPASEEIQLPGTTSNMAADTAQEAEEKEPELLEHTIAKAIDHFLHRARDIEVCERIFVPLAIERWHSERDAIKGDLDEAKDLLTDKSEMPKIIAGVNKVINAIRRTERLKQSQVPKMLESSLFLGLFSAFDVFTGDLLTAVYNKQPELFNKLNKKVSISRILEHTSFEKFKATVLQDIIEKFRRKSYVEQFESLERRFAITLKAFERWSHFVEASQRRNLLTHCGGIVSDQYMEVCKREGYSFASPVVIGDRLELGHEYVQSVCELLMEVALKLGQTLWRKLFPKELGEADSHLRSVIYDCLLTERWKSAQIFGEFAIGQKKVSSDLERKVSIINYAISLKFGSQPEQATHILSEVDWTATINDFKLAETVLFEQYDDAAALMEKIGLVSELINEHAYHEWPLFREFRKTEQFLKAYEKVYQCPFTIEIQKTADAAQLSTDDRVKNEESGILNDFETQQGNDAITQNNQSDAILTQSTVEESAT